MAKKKDSWEQQKGEPAAAYARFLIYRSLGPVRSLDSAYAAYCALADDDSEAKAPNGTKKPVPGSWKRECSTWRWSERAAAWDLACLAELGQEAIVAFAAFLKALSLRSLEVLRDPAIQPRTWDALLYTAEVLNGLIAPEAVQAALSQQSVHRGPEPPPIAGSVGR